MPAEDRVLAGGLGRSQTDARFLTTADKGFLARQNKPARRAVAARLLDVVRPRIPLPPRHDNIYSNCGVGLDCVHERAIEQIMDINYLIQILYIDISGSSKG